MACRSDMPTDRLPGSAPLYVALHLKHGARAGGSPFCSDQSLVRACLASPHLWVLFLVFCAGLPPSAARAQAEFSCTEVLGFSQSLQWYTGGSRPEGGNADRSAELRVDQFLPNWQGRFTFGAAIDRWKDDEYLGWEGVYVSREPCPREEIDRVVFNVSGSARSIDEWVAAIDSVASLVTIKYPAAREVVMQPVVGAPEAKCEQVRAAQNHPVIFAAIAVVAERHVHITQGPGPKVATCDEFADQMGHLTEAGAQHIQHDIRVYFRVRSDGR